MCVIIDANVASKVLSEKRTDDFIPVCKWLDEDGCLVHGGTLTQELFKVEDVRRKLLDLQRSGRAVVYNKDVLLEEEASVVDSGLCQSNDHHVIALARVSGARTLCSHDKALHVDFKNPELVDNPRGSVYQNASHRHLLKHTSSCGR